MKNDIDIINDNKFLSEIRFKTKFSNIYNNIIIYTSFLDNFNPTFSERKYCYINNIQNILYCPICGKKLKFKDINRGYGIACSNSCKQKYIFKNMDEEKIKLINDKRSKSVKNTIFNKSQIEKENISKKISQYYNNMCEEQKLNRSKKISISSKIERSNRTENDWNKIKEKRYQIYQNKSKEEIDSINKKISNAVKNTMNSKSKEEWLLIEQKKYKTKKQNNSFNTSKPEDEIYNMLLSKFPNCKYQYKTNLYPFACDFYIPELDLYIEINFHWTHNNKPFVNNDIDCIKQLNEWKEKSINSKFYQNAIKVWTELDIKKRQVAKNNNLNWIEFFNMSDFNKWFEEL